MATVTRSSVVQPGDTIQLKAIFKGPGNVPTDLDSFPTITIVQTNGNVVVGPTSAGVYRISNGEYGFSHKVGLQPDLGTWTDIWQGTMSGFNVVGEFNFTVYTTQVPGINTDGYIHLGDDPGYCYSQNAIRNINLLIKLLRARLKSAGKSRSKDEHGNIIYKDCDIYNIDELVAFLVQSISEFNEIPHFTFFTFEDTQIINVYAAVLVQGALLMALSSQALIERGREFTLNDSGTSYTPPTVSDMLNTQWSAELSNWYDKVKLIKMNMKPAPLMLGTLRPLHSLPAMRRLRMLRERQIY